MQVRLYSIWYLKNDLFSNGLGTLNENHVKQNNLEIWLHTTSFVGKRMLNFLYSTEGDLENLTRKNGLDNAIGHLFLYEISIFKSKIGGLFLFLCKSTCWLDLYSYLLYISSQVRTPLVVPKP